MELGRGARGEGWCPSLLTYSFLPHDPLTTARTLYSLLLFLFFLYIFIVYAITRVPTPLPPFAHLNAALAPFPFPLHITSSLRNCGHPT